MLHVTVGFLMIFHKDAVCLRLPFSALCRVDVNYAENNMGLITNLVNSNSQTMINHISKKEKRKILPIMTLKLKAQFLVSLFPTAIFFPWVCVRIGKIIIQKNPITVIKRICGL